LPSGRCRTDALRVDRSSSAENAVLPGLPVLFLCASVLFAGYVAAALRPLDRHASAIAVPPAVPVTETAEP